MTPDKKRELVRAFMDAWERADADAVMQSMAEDCIYSASVGREPGLTSRGRVDMARGVGEMLAFEADGESKQGRVWFAEDRAFAEWDYDVITDDGGLKPSYGKIANRPRKCTIAGVWISWRTRHPTARNSGS